LSFSKASVTVRTTIGVGIIGSLYIAYLAFVSPIQDDSISPYGYMDKRWLLALYGLGIVLVYFPAAFKQLLELPDGDVRNASKMKVRDRATARFCDAPEALLKPMIPWVSRW
jgi:hypothetical protein